MAEITEIARGFVIANFAAIAEIPENAKIGEGFVLTDKCAEVAEIAKGTRLPRLPREQGCRDCRNGHGFQNLPTLPRVPKLH